MNLLSNASTMFRYIYYDYWEENADPRTAHYPLISNGPDQVLAIISGYLVLVTIIGPWFMRNRPAYVMKGPMLLYNTLMVVCNAYFFLFTLFNIDNGRVFLNFKSPNMNDTSPQTLKQLSVGYLCYLSKFLDLMDTVFFVLRKSDRQITFLHLYHHSFVPILGWMSFKIAPQIPVLKLFLLLNCLIHTIMYSYYALASFGPWIQKYLWWKKYITQLQLLQFAICFVYTVFMIFLQEGFPAGLFWIGFAQNPFFFYMFYSFYRQSYKTKATKKLDQKVE